MSRHVLSCCLLLLLVVCACHGFHVTGTVSYSPWCDRWTVTGTVTLSQGELKEFDSKVFIQTATHDWTVGQVYTSSPVCVVDLTTSASKCGASAGDVCHVISKVGDTYNISVSRPMLTSHRGMAVQAVLQSKSKVSKSSFGNLPRTSDVTTRVKNPEFTYHLDDEPVQHVGDKHTVPITACSDKSLQIKVCVENPREKSVLKMYSNGQSIHSQPPCVETIARYKFSHSVENEIEVDYEDNVCFIRKSVTLEVAERNDNVCNVLEKEPQETPTPKPCSDPSLSKPREIITLSEPLLEVMCDTVSDGGGWIVFQRRISDSDFYLGWDSYRTGFGNLGNNFWLGLDKIYKFCNKMASCQLRVDFEYKNKKYYAMYQNFYLDGPAEKFRLHIGSYSGNAGDSLTYHNGQQFSTKDNDNDAISSRHCATEFKGAWWYKFCHEANLNGIWGSTTYGQGLNWYIKTGYTSVSLSEIKLRLI